jgi:hypothetical protein
LNAETVTIELVGGPACQTYRTTREASTRWDLLIRDRLRHKLHHYQRLSPTSRAFGFKQSIPLRRRVQPSALDRAN